MRPDLVVAPQSGAIRAMMTPYLEELTTGGLTVYPRLALYWQDADRTPYLVRVGAEDAGFALVRRHAATDFREMAEFYIAPAWRRQGIGREAALALFGRQPGWWHLQILETNTAAQAFWRRVIPVPVRESAQRGTNGRRFSVLQFRTGDLHA
jgi:predicted acetyltransferase